MRTLLGLAAALLMIAPAQAMDISLGTPMPLVVDSDLTFEENGREVHITGPWVRQSLNIMNDDPDFKLVITAISVNASCLEDTYGYEGEIHASFDHEYMNVEIPVAGSPFDTGEMYIYDLTEDCKKGHLVRMEVEGELVDEHGNNVEQRQSTAFITRR